MGWGIKAPCPLSYAKSLPQGCLKAAVLRKERRAFTDKKRSMDGQWTVNFNNCAAGFLIPIRGFDGHLQGCQIRLDKPFKGKRKYVWLSSADKPGGVSAGSFLHFAGNPRAETVYVTEGAYCRNTTTIWSSRKS
jgi:hypothetical protein